MPVYKYLGNRFLTFVGNIISGQNLSEFHSGMRAYTRQVLETIPWMNNSDDFVFDSEFLTQMVYFGSKLGNIPVPVGYVKEASSIASPPSIKYGLQILICLAGISYKKCNLASDPILEGKGQKLD